MSSASWSQAHLEASVRAQAKLRVKLGVVVDAMMVFTTLYAGTSAPWIGTPEVALMAVVYLAYSVGAWWFAAKSAYITPRRMVTLTAILDPLMLTGWLYLMGEPTILFASFYLFTILGFGFRIGVGPMRLCQAVAMVGLALLVLFSPMWRSEPMSAASHGILLLIVPFYASTLIRNLHDARHHAERESRAKSQLLANVSHELRTPLTGIVSSAQLISAESKDPAVNVRAEAILNLSTALDGEIKQLLDLSKLQAGHALSAAEPFELSSVVERVCLALEPIAIRKNIALNVTFDRRITDKVFGYEHDLASVLTNLAGNAVKFTDTGHVDITVSLASTRGDRYAVGFRVSDTGIGIPAEHLPKIFQPFYQVETGTTRKYGGTGLGTSIAYEHVRRMGGDLEVESEPGRGTSFWFELHFARMAEAPVSADVPESVEASAPEIAPPRRILIADDHPVNLRLLHEMLAKDGHSVTAVGSGEEALHCLAQSEFDAIFLDFNMADIDGASVYQLYRFGRIKTAPTFFITADTSEATAERLLSTGANGLIYKPITFQKLRTALIAERADEQPLVEAPPDDFDAIERPAQNGRGNDPKVIRPLVPSAQLKLVPMEYISQDALDNLREVNPSRRFLEAMLGDAMSDIEKLVVELTEHASELDAQEVHRIAHSLKGVCLNVGAVRLASIAGRLMASSASELIATRQSWPREVRDLANHSVRALNGIIQNQTAVDDRR